MTPTTLAADAAQALQERIAALIDKDQAQLLSDYDVSPEAWKNDPERGEAVRALAEAITAAALTALSAENAELKAQVAELTREREAIYEASDPDFIWGAMDSVSDMDVSLTDYANAASRAIRVAVAALPPAPGAVEALVKSLEANLTFAEKIAEAADIDPEETALNVLVMPEGREVARRTWADVIAQGRSALAAIRAGGA